jgi:ankyrin repeat protein
LHERLFSAATAASVTAKQSNTLVRKKEEGPSPLYVRLRATADLPQRTVWLKREMVVRDVGRGSSRPYLPGVMLLEAATRGMVEVVIALLDAGVSMFETDDEASSALLLSAFHCTSEGHRAVCALLMGRGADPEAANMNGVSPWQCTLMRRDVQLRRTFKPSESDKDCTAKAMGVTELHRAIWARDEQLALSSLDKCGGRLENGITPLMVAGRTGSLRVVQALLDRSARPEKASARGCTAFSIAAEEGHFVVMRTMLAGRGKTPISSVCAADGTGTTPLMRACENDHVQAAELLLDEGSPEDVNRANHKGWTALMLAAFNGFHEVVELLLDYDARAELGRQVAKSTIYTALCYAAWSGHAECVVALVKAGCSFSEQRGPEALELAIRYEHTRCAEELRKASLETAPRAATEGDKAARALARSRRARSAAARTTRKGSDLGPAELTQTASNQIKELTRLQAELAEAQAELARVRAGKRRLRLSEQSSADPIRFINRTPWAFSPSGRWRPGLWSGQSDRNTPISCEFGEPPRSIGLVDKLPLGSSSLWSA